jgi:hypothetical protein
MGVQFFLSVSQLEKGLLPTISLRAWRKGQHLQN